jgi:endonuclease YncB( thermonuclease family)
MKKIIVISTVAMIVLLTSALPSGAQTEATFAVAKVVSVLDGDSILVEYISGGDGLTNIISGYLIDAPEDGVPVGQCYGAESTAFARGILGGATVWLTHHNRVSDSGELMAFLYLDSDRISMFQAIALSQGAALPVVNLPEEQPFINRVVALFNEARDASRGLWDVCQVQDTSDGTTATGTNVVINELELNPSGADAGFQFVELFNPTTEAIDLTGWRLMPSQGFTITIPSGLVIPAGGVGVIQASVQFLNNQNEVVQLQDPNGNVVDTSPLLSDTEDDNRCWAQVPNGSNNWVFQTCTQNAPNS